MPTRPAQLTDSDLERRAVADTAPAFDPRPSAGSVQVGAKARRLQRRLLLRDRSLEGLYWLFEQYIGRPLVNLCRIPAMIRLLGTQVQREFGVPIWRQVLDQIRLIVFHGAKAWVYYVLEFYRDGAMANV